MSSCARFRGFGFSQRQRPELPPPTHANVAYGEHPSQILDFWKADTGARGRLAINIHGGGFTGGSKDGINAATVKRLLASGIHGASFEYRLIEHAKLPAAHRDVARALQFVRSKAREWPVDSKLIGAFGGSAGGQLSAYLAFHDDISIINHITPDDSPVYVSYRMAPDEPIPTKNPIGWKIHHVNFGIAMDEKLRLAGVESTLDYPGPETRYESVVDFMTDKLAWEGQRELFTQYEVGSFVGSEGERIDFQLMKPRDFDPSQTYPLVVFLHGSGGRGSANIQNLTDDDVPAQLARDSVAGSHRAFYLVSQCPGPKTWGKGSFMERRSNLRPSKQDVLLELVDEVVATNAIDKDRLYVTGLSMGGFGTFSSVASRPDFWAAAAPICGGWKPQDAEKFTGTPMWLFHGDQDRAVDVQLSLDMDKATRATGGHMCYTEYPGVGHNSWLNAYWEDELWNWILLKDVEEMLERENRRESATCMKSEWLRGIPGRRPMFKASPRNSVVYRGEIVRN